MKKMCKKYVLIWITLLLIISLFQPFIWVNADYNKVDEFTEYYKNINNANKLAIWWIIEDNSSNPTNYRLKDSISRWEMAKIISKISKIEVVDSCEWKYNDLVSNDWECKYAEAWLKNNYFSDDNTSFRPKDNITKIEALKIIMKAKWIEKSDNIDWKIAYLDAGFKSGLVYPKFTDFDSVAQRGWIIDLVVKNIWNKFIQWDFKAEYIWYWDEYKKSDYINVTMNWQIYRIPGINEVSSEKTKCIENTISQAENMSIAKALCWYCFFWVFEEFSPSWYYLLYNYSWWEFGWLKMVDSKTWKSVIDIPYPNFYSWTKDRKQFIHWSEAWMTSGDWLYITIKWSFPKTKLILDDSIISWYIDEKNIYLITCIYDSQSHNETYYKKTIDIKTEKVIYSEEIK